MKDRASIDERLQIVDGKSRIGDWERGLNKNTNGLLRQYFPKSLYLKTVTQNQMIRAVNRLSACPRKVLEFKIPDQLMSAHRTALAA